jgi:hypothetical protein
VSALFGATAAITVVVGALVLSASIDGLLGSNSFERLGVKIGDRSAASGPKG